MQNTFTKGGKYNTIKGIDIWRTFREHFIEPSKKYAKHRPSTKDLRLSSIHQ